MAVQSIKPQSPTSVISYDAVTIQQHHTEPIYSLIDSAWFNVSTNTV